MREWYLQSTFWKEEKLADNSFTFYQKRRRASHQVMFRIQMEAFQSKRVGYLMTCWDGKSLVHCSRQCRLQWRMWPRGTNFLYWNPSSALSSQCDLVRYTEWSQYLEVHMGTKISLWLAVKSHTIYALSTVPNFHLFSFLFNRFPGSFKKHVYSGK